MTAEPISTNFNLEKASAPPSRSELFGVVSTLFQICTLQQMALRSLRDPQVDEFQDEMQRADAALDVLYKELNALVGYNVER